MIAGYDEKDFGDALKQYFTPAQPVSRPDHLHGREGRMRTISRALSSPGKHVFIHGDRGVGKTSLAKTALKLHLGSERYIPIVACEEQSELFDLVDAVRRQIALYESETTSGAIDLRKADQFAQAGTPLTNAIRSINDAIESLRASVRADGPPMTVIIDEFDQLKNDREKKGFADLIKQLSDQTINLRLVICGIGRSLQELIGVHLSTDRYLSAVELDTIPHDARWQILQAACNHFKVNMDRDSIIRVGQVSDGFPYYVHLMGESIFWSMFDDPIEVADMTTDHYKRGVNAAIEEAQTSLRQTYDLAMQKHGNSEDYEEVLWSVADGTHLKRQVSDIYDQSYLEIMRHRDGRDALKKESFYQRMNKLKSLGHGQILIANRQGWYEFRENMVRGYVRLRAERAGVRVRIDSLRYARAN